MAYYIVVEVAKGVGVGYPRPDLTRQSTPRRTDMVSAFDAMPRFYCVAGSSRVRDIFPLWRGKLCWLLPHLLPARPHPFEPPYLTTTDPIAEYSAGYASGAKRSMAHNAARRKNTTPRQSGGERTGEAGLTVAKRTSNACHRCRRRKIKCSGTPPCRNCDNLGHECIFGEADKLVVVSQRRLRELQRGLSSETETSGSRASGIERAPSRHSPTTSSLPPPTPVLTSRPSGPLQASRTVPTLFEDLGFHAEAISQRTTGTISNPFTVAPSQFAIDSTGRQRYLGHSSTWSFSRQVRTLLNAHLGRDTVQLHDATPGIEGAVYSMSAAISDGIQSSQLPDIPDREHVDYLFGSFRFHLCSVYHFLDPKAFQARLEQHFQTSPGNLQHQGFWHVQLLLVIAFGKMFLGRQSTEFGPPGSEFCVAAIKMLPSLVQMHQDPIASIEVLCLISLFLQCVDMRNAAYLYIGNALYIALSIGMNRTAESHSFEPPQNQHRLKLWWSVYILHRKLSTLMGAPFTLDDHGDINVPLPTNTVNSDFENSVHLALHVTLSQLLGKVMTTVYRLNDHIGKPFLESVQDILADMTSLRGDLDQQTPLKSAVSGGSTSRSSATLHLKYHQCAMLSTRPLLFHLVQKRLTHNESASPDTRVLSETVRALIGTCVDAATASLSILSALHEQDLIELFLPFDSDATFSAAFVIVLASIADPSLNGEGKALDIAGYILHDMASRGNLAVISYEMELNELRRLRADLALQNSARRSPQYDHAQGPDQVSSFTFDANISTMQFALELLDDQFLGNVEMTFPSDEWIFAET